MSISFHALAHHHRHVSLTTDEPLPLPQKASRDWRCDDTQLVAADDVECPEDGQYDGYMMGIDEDSDLDMDMDSQMREWEQERTRTNSDSTHSMSSTTSTESYTSTVSAASSSTSPRQFPFSPSSSSSSQAQSPLSVSSTSSAGSPSSPEPVFSQHHNMKPTTITGFTAPATSTSTSASASASHLQPQQRQPTKSPSGDRALSRRADSRIIALHDKRVALNRKLYRARMAAGAGAGVGAAAAASALARRARNSLTLAVPHPTPNPTPLPSSAVTSPAPALDTSDPSQSLYRDTASPVCRVDPSADSRHPDPIYNVYTYREIARHVSLSSCWLVVRGRVYDITRFIPHHPAGNFSLLKHAGTDATEHFKMHSPEAQRLWETFQIGWLQGYREQPQTPQNNDKCTIM